MPWQANARRSRQMRKVSRSTLWSPYLYHLLLLTKSDSHKLFHHPPIKMLHKISISPQLTNRTTTQVESWKKEISTISSEWTLTQTCSMMEACLLKIWKQTKKTRTKALRWSSSRLDMRKSQVRARRGTTLLRFTRLNNKYLVVIWERSLTKAPS